MQCKNCKEDNHYETERCNQIAKDIGEEPKRMVEFLEALKVDKELGENSFLNWNRPGGL